MRDAEFFKKYIDYDPDLGTFTYKPRSEEEFPTNSEFKRWNNRYAGQPAGGYYVRPDGYEMLRMRVCWGRYVGSRVAAVICGMFPNYDDPRHIDHIDGDPKNNRLSNLRAVDNAINSKNRKMRSDNTTGVTGVQRSKGKWRWKARIADNENDITLGHFDDFFEAVCVRRSAEIRLGYTSRHGR